MVRAGAPLLPFSTALLSLWNSFLFLSRFFVSLKSLNNHFFRRFASKSLLNRFSVLINYIMWSSNNFLHPGVLRFLGSEPRLFRVQVLQGPGFSGFGSRVQVQVLEVALYIFKHRHKSNIKGAIFELRSKHLYRDQPYKKGFGGKKLVLQFHRCFILHGCFWGFWSHFFELFFAELLVTCNKFAILKNENVTKILEVGKFSLYVTLSTLFPKWQNFA